jgi:hypothetical protein
MCPFLMLALITSKILLPQVQFKVISILILCNIITHPEMTHFHRSQTLAFDGVVCNTNGRGVVTMDLCFGLWMAQIFESKMEKHALFAI